MKSKSIPFKNIIDIVFKPKLLPAAYRWISALPPEELIRFKNVFERLSRDEDGQPYETNKKQAPIPASRYTIPEWHYFQVQQEKEKTDEDLLSCPTQTHLTYGAFTQEQALAARAHPLRTRANDRSQINAVADTPEYMARWTQRNMTTARETEQKTLTNSTIQNSVNQKISIYSKGTLTPIAIKRAEKYADIDPQWTRDMRELCRSLINSSESTSYREGFTEVKTVNEERIGIPKWKDPEPVVSRGVHKSPETFWQTTEGRVFTQPEKTAETFHAIDQHRACYQRPFDLYPMAEKMQTTFRADFQDHIANKDEHPEYFQDMRVKMPPGSAVVGDVLGV